MPDSDVVFDGRYYYMVSTTMYFAPSVPIMRSSDLVHWSIAGYAAAILDDADALALRNGQDAYGQGSWAASIRFHDGTYYVSVGSLTTQQTYVYSTPNIERGPCSRSVLDGYAHDQSLLFDGDDVWLVYGGGSIDLRRLRRHDDGTLAWDGPATRLVEDANVDQTSGLNAEGAHAYKIGDYYYVLMIEWSSGWHPPGGAVEVDVTNAAVGGRRVGGPGRAEPGRDGRGPARNRRGPGRSRPDVRRAVVRHAVPGRGPAGSFASARWRDLGRRRVAGFHSQSASARGGARTAGAGAAVVASDDFDNLRERAGYWNTTNADFLTESAENAWNGSNLGLQWQWNHNPDNRFWSLTERPGHLRLTTGSVASSILDARNTLTQRTLGPTSSGAISLDVSHMKDGDVAGISAYQRKYGYIAVAMEGGTRSLVMRRAGGDGVIAFTSAPVPLRADVVYLRADVDFRDAVDTASFAYSYDGSNWTRLGDTVPMRYDLAHFTGYRFALFNYATAEPGGYVDVDWFRVSDTIGLANPTHRPSEGAVHD